MNPEPTTYYAIDPDVESTDRWDARKFSPFVMNDNGEELESGADVLVSPFRNGVKLLDVHGTLRVTVEENNAPLLAYRIYGNVNLWWILCLYNDIEDPCDIPEGTEIQYPKMQDVLNLYFSVKRQRVIT